MEPIRVLVADDHTLFRKGIHTLLDQMPEVDVVGEAASGQEAVAQARELVPDVILMDIKMPVFGGIEATRHLLQENPQHRRYPGHHVRRPRVGLLRHAGGSPRICAQRGRAGRTAEGD